MGPTCGLSPPPPLRCLAPPPRHARARPVPQAELTPSSHDQPRSAPHLPLSLKLPTPSSSSPSPIHSIIMKPLPPSMALMAAGRPSLPGAPSSLPIKIGRPDLSPLPSLPSPSPHLSLSLAKPSAGASSDRPRGVPPDRPRPRLAACARVRSNRPSRLAIRCWSRHSPELDRPRPAPSRHAPPGPAEALPVEPRPSRRAVPPATAIRRKVEDKLKIVLLIFEIAF
jgi:hypothetical protein